MQLQGSPSATEPNQGTRCAALQLPWSKLHEVLPNLGEDLHRRGEGAGAHTVGVGLSIIPSTGGLRWIEVEDSMRRSGRGDSAGKEVRIEDKSQAEKEMSPCPERGAVHRRQPALIASYDPRQPRWRQFFPGPHTGLTAYHLP
ncbi:hypothetical protein PoB_006704400 [Plakobranchus ocellatus]|uniref:Uncharacterized protein n=1 Tax=Plakobranchus ocellatus TaxID=259542 RepID=A0AAV4D8J2_9GAST|nr:hypothetical protein PoB_006704400 [Plakobranchus ocellatus]